ncbi:hypothetical protein [Hymenobacter baengnokdamensis]|uniref:hypothetical protein n=1 Tax=Hymenobacter baengnokdamensis TaxID=2615203 RepID=UPI0012484681|nr:hypothetical protein [Hymenobacter baengnokdamensis]
MAEQDKELPLVVAEILIEMHGMNDRLKGVENHLVVVENRLASVEEVLVQVVTNIQQLTTVTKEAAESADRRQDIANRNFQLLQEAGQRDRELLTSALQSAITVIGRRFDNLENRLERLETK